MRQPHRMVKHTQTIRRLLAGLGLRRLISNFFIIIIYYLSLFKVGTIDIVQKLLKLIPLCDVASRRRYYKRIIRITVLSS